jgi:hypothetical protein
MHGVLSSIVVDLGTARLERALRRLHEQNHTGAMADLRAALRYLRHAGADHIQIRHLIEIIKAAEHP